MHLSTRPWRGPQAAQRVALRWQPPLTDRHRLPRAQVAISLHAQRSSDTTAAVRGTVVITSPARVAASTHFLPSQQRNPPC